MRVLMGLLTGTAFFCGACSQEPEIMIIAHRGLHHTLPENSKEAMVAGWKSGVVWCETDVYLSSDGVPVLMHDAKLDRTTEAKGPVSRRPWSELKQIRLKNPNGSLSDCRIPSLEETLALMPPGCGFLVEIKPANDEKLVRETLRLCAGRKVIIQSFDEPDVRHSYNIAPDVPVAFLLGKPEHLAAAMAGPWKDLNLESKLVTAELLREAKTRGKSIGVWTVDDPLEIRRVLDLGITRIITNEPERVKALSER